jgi:hypothetical protein
MAKIRVQCVLDEAIWARIDALQLSPRGGRGGSAGARREREIVALVTRGIEAIEADRGRVDTEKPLRAPATPRNDLPSWVTRTPGAPDAAPDPAEPSRPQSLPSRRP